MADIIYLRITGEQQGVISAGCSTKDSVGYRYQQRHENEILVYALSYGITREQAPNYRPLTFTKLIDKSSPLFGIAMSNNESFFLEFDFFRINPYGQWQKYYFIELRGATLDSLHTHFVSDVAGHNDEETVSVRYQYVRSCHLIANTEQRELILPSQYDRLFTNKNPIIAQRNATVAAGLAVGRGAVAGQAARSALSAAASRIPPINPLTAGVMGMLYSSEVGKGSDIIPPEYKHSIEDKAPNLGAVLSDSVKQELGGVGAGTPGGWGPEDEEKAFEEAKKRYPKQYEQYKKLPDENLRKAVAKHDKQIMNHRGYLNDVLKRQEHVPSWDSLSKQHQENLLHHWQQDIKRHEAYKSIANGVLRGRK